MTHILDFTPGQDHESQKAFALIGEFVTTYQQVEDCLMFVFTSAISDELRRSSNIFNVFRGLDQKLQAIEAALVYSTDDMKAKWSKLAIKIRKAADARNDMAHGRPKIFGPLTIIPDQDGGAQVFQKYEQFELHKHKPKTVVVWTEDTIQKALAETVSLYDELCQFSGDVRGWRPVHAELDPNLDASGP